MVSFIYKQNNMKRENEEGRRLIYGNARLFDNLIVDGKEAAVCGRVAEVVGSSGR